MDWLRRLTGRRRQEAAWGQPPPDPDLQTLLDEYGLMAFDRQVAFSEIVGDRDWTISQDDGILRLGDDIALPAQMLGSISAQSNTWLWAWANSSIDEALTARARDAARIGADRGLPILVEPQFDVARIVDGHLLTLAVAGLLDADAYFVGPHPGGAVFLLVSEPRVRHVDMTPEQRALNTVYQALMHTPQLLNRRGIGTYLRLLGLPVVESPGELRIGEGETGVFSFDDLGRLTQVHGTLGDESPDPHVTFSDAD